VIGLLPRHPGLVGCDVLAKDPPQHLDAAREEGVAGEGLRMREDRSSVGHHRDQLPLLPLQVMPTGARRGSWLWCTRRQRWPAELLKGSRVPLPGGFRTAPIPS